MGDQRPVAPRRRAASTRAREAVAERAGRRLEQDPAPGAEGDPRQLLLARGPRPPSRRPRRPAARRSATALLDEAPRSPSPPGRPAPRSGRRGRGGYAGSRRSRSIPSAAPWRAMPTLSRRSSAPSSTPGKDVAVEVDHVCKPSFQASPADRHAATMIGMIHHLLPLGLRERNGLQLMDKKTTRRGNYESGSDYVLEYGELRFAFNEEDFGQRVEQAAVKLGFVAPGASARRSSTTSSTSRSAARSPSPAPASASTSTRTGRTWSAPPTAASSTGSAVSSSAAPGSTSGSRRVSSTSSSTSAPRPSATSSRTAAPS